MDGRVSRGGAGWMRPVSPLGGVWARVGEVVERRVLVVPEVVRAGAGVTPDDGAGTGVVAAEGVAEGASESTTWVTLATESIASCSSLAAVHAASAHSTAAPTYLI